MRRALALVLAGCAALPAQEPPSFRASAEEVLAGFIVRDWRGRQITDLRPEEIELLKDGAPQAHSGAGLDRKIGGRFSCLTAAALEAAQAGDYELGAAAGEAAAGREGFAIEP